MNHYRGTSTTTRPPHAALQEQTGVDAEPLIHEDTFGDTLSEEARDTFILDRFSTALEDPHTGRKITRHDSEKRRA